MAWQDTAQQLLGGQAGPVIQRLQSINPNYDWSKVIAQYVPALNAAYGTDWQDTGRGSSEGIVSALLQNAQADGERWAASALPEQQQRQQQQQNQIQRSQVHRSGGLFGDLGPLAQLAALIPGPQQPFLLAANAANAASQGNLIGAGLNAFGAYNGGVGGSVDKLSDMFNPLTANNPDLSGPNMGFKGDTGNIVPRTGISMPNNIATGIGPGGTSLVGNNMDLPLQDDWNFNVDSAGGAPDYSSVGGGGGLNDVMNDGSNVNSPNYGGVGGFNPGSTAGMNLGELFKQYGPTVARILGQSGVLGSGVSSMLGGSQGGYQFPWGNVIGSAIGAYGSNQSMKTLADAMRYASDKADPFASQRPTYQAQLPGAINDFRNTISSKDSGYADLSGRLDAGFNTMQGQYRDQFNNARAGYQSGFNDLFSKIQAENTQMRDPNYWNNDSLLAGLNDMAVNDTSRKLASQGYNMSGNIPMEVAQRLQQNNATYVPKFIDTITNNQNVSLGGYNANTNTNLGAINQAAATNLGAYNTNAGNMLSGYNSNSRNTLDAMYNNMSKIGTYAGGEVNPNTSAEIAAKGALAMPALNNQTYGNLGAGLQSIFTGNQPSAVNQLFGANKNNTLGDVFKNWSLS